MAGAGRVHCMLELHVANARERVHAVRELLRVAPGPPIWGLALARPGMVGPGQDEDLKEQAEWVAQVMEHADSAAVVPGMLSNLDPPTRRRLLAAALVRRVQHVLARGGGGSEADWAVVSEQAYGLALHQHVDMEHVLHELVRNGVRKTNHVVRLVAQTVSEAPNDHLAGQFRDTHTAQDRALGAGDPATSLYELLFLLYDDPEPAAAHTQPQDLCINMLLRRLGKIHSHEALRGHARLYKHIFDSAKVGLIDKLMLRFNELNKKPSQTLAGDDLGRLAVLGFYKQDVLASLLWTRIARGDTRPTLPQLDVLAANVQLSLLKQAAAAAQSATLGAGGDTYALLHHTLRYTLTHDSLMMAHEVLATLADQPTPRPDALAQLLDLLLHRVFAVTMSVPRAVGRLVPALVKVCALR